jgi:hypothetical protein
VSDNTGIPGYVGLLFRDNNTGEELARDVPHLGSTWKPRGLQPGQSGSSMVGTATIILPGPGTDEFAENADLFRNILVPGVRVEGYIGGRVLVGDGLVPQSSGPVGGPAWAGIIQPPIRRQANGSWELTVALTPWMLSQSQLYPGEAIHYGGSSVTPFAILQSYIGTREYLWADDFLNWFGTSAVGAPASTDYTNSNWGATGADPALGLPALISAAASTESNIVTTTTWGTSSPASGPWATSQVGVHGVLVMGTDANNAGNVGIWLFASSNFLNALLVDFIAQPQAVSGWYSFLVRIHTRVGGVFTTLSQSFNKLPNTTSPFEFRLEALLRIVAPDPAINSPGTGALVVSALLNGQDTGVQAGYINVGPGRIGLRSLANAPGAPLAYINRIVFDSRTSTIASQFGQNRFKFGTFNTFGAVPSAPIESQGQSHLDVLAMLANATGFYARVRPGAVTNVNPGTDYTTRVLLEEGRNIDNDGTEVAAIPEIFGTGVKLAGIPSGDSGGLIQFDAIAKPGDAMLLGSYSEMGIPGFTLLGRFARQLQGRRANPLIATAVNVIRDAEWVRINDGLGPRELSVIKVNHPTLGIYNESLIMIGYDFVEGFGKQMVYFSSLPYGVPNDIAIRLRGPIDWLTSTYQAR